MRFIFNSRCDSPLGRDLTNLFGELWSPIENRQHAYLCKTKKRHTVWTCDDICRPWLIQEQRHLAERLRNMKFDRLLVLQHDTNISSNDQIHVVAFLSKPHSQLPHLQPQKVRIPRQFVALGLAHVLLCKERAGSEMPFELCDSVMLCERVLRLGLHIDHANTANRKRDLNRAFIQCVPHSSENRINILVHHAAIRYPKSKFIVNRRVAIT